jgi:mono/diheme cytochrome c family protein
MHRRLFLLPAILIVALFAGLLIFALMPTATADISTAGAASGNVQSLIENGKYVAIAADCAACHSAPGGKPFAGGLPMASPVGTIYSTNITPDKNSGIGKYSLNDFDRAVRHGIAANGTSLYPAMPYPSYARMTDADLRALYAYFTLDVTPVATENRPNDIRWPLSMRWPLAIWRKLYAPPVVSVNLAHYTSAEIARGAYLTQSLGHCGACHTPRAVTLQETSLDESQMSYLSGGPDIDGWVAVNLRGNKAAGLGNWSAQQIADILRSGRNLNSAVVGKPMADVITHSTQHMTDPDLQAIAAYLKTLTPGTENGARFEANTETANLLKAGLDNGRGSQLYVDNCAACHRSNGLGSANVFPSIAGNATVLASNPTTLIRLVLAGSTLPSTKTAPSNLGMPGFAWRLSDEETALLVTFVRQSWGNSSSATSATDVAIVRKSLKKPS